MTKVNYISVAKKSAAIQIKELKKINKVFNKNFVKAVDIIHKAKGKVVCSGVGKSGLIARKVSASLSSVGISSFFLDPNSAIHGDLGQIDKERCSNCFFLFWKYFRINKSFKILK